MISRPILFQGAMVRALLDGSKTQTRRICKPQPPANTHKVLTYHYPDPRDHFWAYVNKAPNEAELSSWVYPCPYGQPGDQLWVREAWGARFSHSDFGAVALHWNDLRGPLKKYRTLQNLALYAMKADGQNCGGWIPSIHMPRWASRITLEITGVRVERLQDISETDAKAEGCTVWPECKAPAAYNLYRALWDSINGAESWNANPWVWVVEFKVVNP